MPVNCVQREDNRLVWQNLKVAQPGVKISAGGSLWSRSDL